MQQKNVLLICGGGGTEHDISLQSATYFLEKLSTIPNVITHYICIQRNGDRTNLEGQQCELRKAGELFNRETEKTVKLDYAIPCIHGPPGENGQIQSVFELMGLRYLGATPEASLNCFNKVTTKLWLSSANIRNAPFIYLTDNLTESINTAKEFMLSEAPNGTFVKAASQGSSIGCYKCSSTEQIEELVNKAFQFSSYVIIEKAIKGRELEVAVFTYEERVIATSPGEISCTEGFYSFEEKYSQESTSKVDTVASSITPLLSQKIKDLAIKSFKTLQIKDLARVDFFLTSENEIYVNEINTFPGHTKISMFPLMLENTGLKYADFLKEKIK